MNTIIHFLSRRFALAVFLVASSTIAQVGNDNPTSPSGQFNGNVTTGCSYDPYTANATRSITDLAVAGGVSAYPLAFTRTSNSRIFGWSYFGISGGWQHSYDWSIPEQDFTDHNANPPNPTPGYVNFPDGRVVPFSYSASDIYYRGPAGVRERFQPFNATTHLGYLILPDGGKVEFKQTRTDYYPDTDYTPSRWLHIYTYQAQAIIDPYGQRTNFTYNTDGTLQKVTEPGGRWIQITYTGAVGNRIISQVSGSDGRSVNYYYVIYSGVMNVLDHVIYFGDSTLTAHYRYCAPNVGTGIPLLWTCDDPMYAGPMRRIGYVYRTTTNPDGTAPVYGQIQSENYYDGTTVGAAVSTLLVNGSTRTETRGDGTNPTRTFTYTGYNLTSDTDFRTISASKTYDSNGYLSSVTDRNGHTTNFTANALNGAILTTTVPSTPGDTPTGTPRGVVTCTYGSAACPDVNNRDANNPYYPYSTTDEGGNVTTYTRDTSKRVTQINYPDTGSESFTYNSFGQVLTHVLKTGGTETFTYDGTGTKLTFRNPSNASGNPTARYAYDSANRRSDVTDALGTAVGDANHTTSYTYSTRSQLTVTTLPTDPIDGVRHTIQNTYNSNGDGTLISVTDQLGHVTSFTYDDYRRPLTKTTPTYQTANFYYDATGAGNDYTHTDANVTHMTLPRGEKATTAYDNNFRKISIVVADGTSDAAKTSYGYDNNGNLTSVVSPKEQSGQTYAGKSTVAAYDERNRPMSVTDPLGNVTSCSYDAAAHKASSTRPNGQITTYDSYDAMNRLLQQTVKQTPDPDAVTKYTYYSSGLLHTMQDPHLVATSSIYNYSYSYDTTGRKIGLTYPDSSNEAWHYDTVGRSDTFTNRATNLQTLTYDALNRPTQASWNDGGITPTVTLGYDVASRTTSITNANATITHAYFNDNLLNTETTTYADSTARTVTYTYNADAARATIQYPSAAYSFTYNYTWRNQLQTVVNNSGGGTVITYWYDPDGNLTTRTPDNSTSSTYTYDALDRVTNISHSFVSDPLGPRTFAYAYDSVSNRKWTKREGGTGDIFGYDLNDQVTATLLNVGNPDTTSVGSQTIKYDANGNRTTFAAYGPTDTYTTNSLNQYTARNSSSATYYNGNMTTGVDGSTYTYDAQNRLLTATKSGSTETFKYDGLNRQVSRTIGAASPVYNVYDGWNLIAEYQPAATTPLNAYVYGAGGLVKLLTSSSSFYYYQDTSGCTSHLADSTGHLVEWYRYDLQGTPIFYNSSNSQISASFYGIRHLFTGQQWYGDIGLYDLRNRFYSPDIGRFLQADPIGFDGDATNLYRYCGNNPLSYADPFGLWTGQIGLSFTYQMGSFVLSGSFGVAFDGHGNYAPFIQTFTGSGDGGDVSIALIVAGSRNADNIGDLKGPFWDFGGEISDEGSLSVAQWGNKEGTVTGTTIGLGLGGGGGLYAGQSTTSIGYDRNIFGGGSSPGGTSNIPPEVYAPGTVVVVGTPVGSDLFSGGTGITDFGPGNNFPNNNDTAMASQTYGDLAALGLSPGFAESPTSIGGAMGWEASIGLNPFAPNRFTAR
jgi:RHS repeat-associated protein